MACVPHPSQPDLEELIPSSVAGEVKECFEEVIRYLGNFGPVYMKSPPNG
jgi:hypothetical protein